MCIKGRDNVDHPPPPIWKWDAPPPWGKLTIDCGEGRKYPLVYASKMHGIGTSLHTCLLIKNQRNNLALIQALAKRQKV